MPLRCTRSLEFAVKVTPTLSVCLQRPLYVPVGVDVPFRLKYQLGWSDVEEPVARDLMTTVAMSLVTYERAFNPNDAGTYTFASLSSKLLEFRLDLGSGSLDTAVRINLAGPLFSPPKKKKEESVTDDGLTDWRMSVQERAPEARQTPRPANRLPPVLPLPARVRLTEHATNGGVAIQRRAAPPRNVTNVLRSALRGSGDVGRKVVVAASAVVGAVVDWSRGR